MSRWVILQCCYRIGVAIFHIITFTSQILTVLSYNGGDSDAGTKQDKLPKLARAIAFEQKEVN